MSRHQCEISVQISSLYIDPHIDTFLTCKTSLWLDLYSTVDSMLIEANPYHTIAHNQTSG